MIESQATLGDLSATPISPKPLRGRLGIWLEPSLYMPKGLVPEWEEKEKTNDVENSTRAS